MFSFFSPTGHFVLGTQMHNILWLVTRSHQDIQSLGVHEIVTSLSHRKSATLRTGIHQSLCPQDTTQVSWDQTLVSSYTKDTAQLVKNALTVNSTGKDFKATGQGSSLWHPRKGRPTDQLSSRCCQLQDCSRIVGTNDMSRGDTYRNTRAELATT